MRGPWILHHRCSPVVRGQSRHWRRSSVHHTECRHINKFIAFWRIIGSALTLCYNSRPASEIIHSFPTNRVFSSFWRSWRPWRARRVVRWIWRPWWLQSWWVVRLAQVNMARWPTNKCDHLKILFAHALLELRAAQVAFEVHGFFAYYDNAVPSSSPGWLSKGIYNSV